MLPGSSAPDPLLPILGAGAILIALYVGLRLWRRGKMRRKIKSALGVPDLLQVTPAEFEEMVAELFRSFGHKVKQVQAPGDHGTYLTIQARNGQKWIALCKRQRGSLDDRIVRDFDRFVKYEKANRGVIVATGAFTDQARQWAKNNSILVYDGDEFLKAWKRALKR